MKSAGSQVADGPVIRISADERSQRLSLRELWEFRPVLFMMMTRNISSRYKDTLLGFLWAVLQPLSYMLVLNLFFGVYARFPSDDIPYPVFLFTALVPFQMFTKAINEGAASLRNNHSLVQKIYMPRIILPLSVVGTAVMDFIVAMALVGIMLVYYDIHSNMNLLALPVLVLFLILAAAGMAILTSMLTVRYSDLRLAVPVITQILFFATPIIYPVSVVPEHLRAYFGINPMVGLIESFRWCLLGLDEFPDVDLVLVSAITIVVMFLFSIYYFKRAEMAVADIL